jgi:nickel-type superoxide dismutase maturation protease
MGRTPSSDVEPFGTGVTLPTSLPVAIRGARRLGAVAVTAVVAGVAVRIIGPRRVVVEGASMEPTLRDGDRLLVVKRPGPGMGRIVALEDPRGHGRLLLKRVVSVLGGRIVVEGDNKARSTDSRAFGPVDRQAIVGRAVYRYSPPDRAGPLRRSTKAGSAP